MEIKTSDSEKVTKIVSQLKIPQQKSHKGENGKLLIIGGSSLFHAASLWAAQIASHFVDMVHYSSTIENEAIFIALKTKFTNGIVVPQAKLPEYIVEDGVVLVGPGMVRGDEEKKVHNLKKSFAEIVAEKNEALYTRELIYYLITNFPEKKYVFDAGALQMMDAEWLPLLKTAPILTPHQKEFKELFGIDLMDKSIEEKSEIVKKVAYSHKCVILLKAIVDIASDGYNVYIIEGGNQGLTKGGTGDVLAGLVASLRTANEALLSAVCSSVFLKKTADGLSNRQGYWYNNDNLIENIPGTVNTLVLRS